MSVLESLKGRASAKPTPHSMRAPDVAEKLKIAEGELAVLDAQYGQQALDALMGDGDTAALSRKLVAARENVATLRAAFKAAQDREAEEIIRQRVSLQKTQINAVRKSLARRDAAAEALQTKIVEATEQFHILMDESASAMRACPVGFSWPGGSLCSQDEIRTLVENEFYRAGATPGNKDGRALPGAVADHTKHEWDPRGIDPVVDKIKQASANVLTKLTGKALG